MAALIQRLRDRKIPVTIFRLWNDVRSILNGLDVIVDANADVEPLFATECPNMDSVSSVAQKELITDHVVVSDSISTQTPSLALLPAKLGIYYPVCTDNFDGQTGECTVW